MDKNRIAYFETTLNDRVDLAVSVSGKESVLDVLLFWEEILIPYYDRNSESLWPEDLEEAVVPLFRLSYEESLMNLFCLIWETACEARNDKEMLKEIERKIIEEIEQKNLEGWREYEYP